MTTRRPPTVLLTGFDAFGGEAVNPSWLAVKRLHGTTIARHRVVTRQLPTEFARAPALLLNAIARHRPSLVLCVGQAGGRAAVSIERVAVNLADARIADNAGARPVDQAVIADAPAAYFARLPVKAMVASLREAGIPAEVSQTAGAFVCNAVFFGLCHLLATELTGMRGGFVHVPFVPEQAASKPGVPSMALDTIVDALRICVRVALSRNLPSVGPV